MPIIAYWVVGKFSRKNPIGVRATDTITVPYTDIATNRDSFNDLIFTLRVSKERNNPTSKTTPLHAKRTGNHAREPSDVQIPNILGKSSAYMILSDSRIAYIQMTMAH